MLCELLYMQNQTKCCKIFNFSSLILQFPITNNIFRSENTEIRSENIENQNLNFKSFSDRKIRKIPEFRKFFVTGQYRKTGFRRKIEPWPRSWLGNISVSWASFQARSSKTERNATSYRAVFEFRIRDRKTIIYRLLDYIKL